MRVSTEEPGIHQGTPAEAVFISSDTWGILGIIEEFRRWRLHLIAFFQFQKTSCPYLLKVIAFQLRRIDSGGIQCRDNILRSLSHIGDECILYPLALPFYSTDILGRISLVHIDATALRNRSELLRLNALRHLEKILVQFELFTLLKTVQDVFSKPSEHSRILFGQGVQNPFDTLFDKTVLVELHPVGSELANLSRKGL